MRLLDNLLCSFCWLADWLVEWLIDFFATLQTSLFVEPQDTSNQTS